jgi:fumarate reductase iron-sulfur subunit
MGHAAPVTNELKVEVWRGDSAGTLQTYVVPRSDKQTVLDVVTYIQRRLDPTLSYRFACRVGMCGSCAMTVNGKPRWTCRASVERVAEAGSLELRPLRNMPVIKDLAVDMTGFFEKWQEAKGRFAPTTTRHDPIAVVPPASPARQAADAGIECINCGICVAACDVVAWDPAYQGPAALNRAWTLQNDVRDGDHQGRLEAVTRASGCLVCHSMGSCARHCPNSLNPTASIAGLKRLAVKAALKGSS